MITFQYEHYILKQFIYSRHLNEFYIETYLDYPA